MSAGLLQGFKYEYLAPLREKRSQLFQIKELTTNEKRPLMH